MPLCDRCPLYKTAKSVCVQGRGSPSPDILIIGEAPGSREDYQGSPFVGPSGEKLDQYLAHVGIDLRVVRWTNAVRCFPKNADGKPRRPDQNEIEACVPYLWDEIVRTRPKVIVTLGNTPMQILTGKKSVVQARGRSYPVKIGEEEFHVVPTIHPAAVLYGKTQYEPMIMQDLDLARRVVTGETGIMTHVFSLDTVEKVQNYLAKVKAMYKAGQIPFLSLDLETWADCPDKVRDYKNGLNMFHPTSRILCVSLAHRKGQGFVIPYRHKQSPFSNAQLADIDEAFTDCLSEVKLGGQNLFFDIRYIDMCTRIRLRHNPVAFDTMLASHVLFADTEEHGLDALATKFAGFIHHKDEMHEALKELPAGQRNMENVALDVFNRYAAGDADAVIRLYEVFQPMLDRLDLNYAMQELMVNSADFFVHLSINGCAIDREAVQAAMRGMEGELTEITKQAKDLGLEAALQYVYTLDWQRDVESFLKKNDLDIHELYKKTYDTPPDRGQFLALLEEAEKYPTVAELKSRGSDEAAAKAWRGLLTKVRSVLRRKMKPEKVAEISLGSDNQVRTILFNILGIIPSEEHKTESGADYSVDKMAQWHYAEEAILVYRAYESRLLDVMISPEERIAYKTEMRRCSDTLKFLAALQAYKKKSKVYSTYYKPLDGPALHEDGMIHCHVKNGAQETGRTTITGPPVPTYPRGSAAKKAFISRYIRGLILASDYSQHELRVMACLSGDPGLIEIFSSGGDAHYLVAADIFEKPVEDVTKEERSIAKATSFGIPYGLSDYGLADSMKKSLEFAQDIKRKFYDRFGGLVQMIEKYKYEGHKEKAVRTPTGRRRPLQRLDPAFHTQMGWDSRDIEREVAGGERQAVNTPIQAAASDLTVQAGQRIDELILRHDLMSKVWGFIHDSLLFDTHPYELMWLASALRQIMVHDVPGLYDWAGTTQWANDYDIGVSWGQMCSMTFDEKTLTLEGKALDVDAVEARLTGVEIPFALIGQETYEKKDILMKKAAYEVPDLSQGHPPIVIEPQFANAPKFFRSFL